jgi:hypothetical protein
MIVRILGDGQYRVPDAHGRALAVHDDEVTAAYQAGDERGFRAAVRGLLAEVRAVGDRLPPESLDPSDVVLPADDATIADVHDLFTDQGLIPD